MPASRLLVQFYNPLITKPMRYGIPQWMSFGASTHTITAQEAQSQASWGDLCADNSGTSYGLLIAGMRATNPDLTILDYLLQGLVDNKNPGADSSHPISAFQVGAVIPVTSITVVGATTTYNLASGHGYPVDPGSSADNTAWVRLVGGPVAGGADVTSQVLSVPSATSLTTNTSGAVSARTINAGTLYCYSMVGGTGNFMMEFFNQAYKDRVVNLALNHLSNVNFAPGYDGTIIDVMGITNLFGGTNPNPWDESHNAQWLADRWMNRTIGQCAYVSHRLCRSATLSSISVDPSAPPQWGNGYDSGSASGGSAVKFPFGVNGLGHGDDYWGNNQYSTANITGTASVNGTLYTVTSNGHGFEPNDWVSIAGHSTAQANNLWQVVSVTVNTITVDTKINGLAAGTGGTVRRSNATLLLNRACDIVMMEEFIRGENGSLTNWPGDILFQQCANAAIDTQIRNNVFWACSKVWVAHTHQQYPSSGPGKLTTALVKNNNYTSLATSSWGTLTAPIPVGATIWIWDGNNNSQSFIVSAPITSNATSVSITGFAANANYGTANSQVWYTNQDGKMDSQENAFVDQWHKLCLATAMLVNNGLLVFHFRHDFGSWPGSGGREQEITPHTYYLTIQNTMGRPTQFWNTQPDPSGSGGSGGIIAAKTGFIYTRTFQNGLVLVNPDNASHNFTRVDGLGNLVNIDFRDATSYTGTVTVPANSGLILRKP
jgi:hypothetical protein